MTTPQKVLTRRKFFKWLSATGLGGALLGWQNANAFGREKGSNKGAAQMRVPKRTFGNTGLRLPILSLGGIFNTGENHVMMHQAVKWGVTYWDTATRYNRWGSEPGIGRYFQRFPDHRQKIFLVTKSPTIMADGIDRHLDASLKLLQTDYIDLYFIHHVDDVADELTKEIRQWVDKAKASGKIKLFGFSTHANMAANLTTAAKMDWIDGIMTTYNYRLMVDSAMNRALDACHKAGIGLTAMKTQAVSVRGHEMGTETDAALKLTKRFMDKGFTLHQARLMAVWSDQRITSICSQMENMTILKENVAAAAASSEAFGQGDFNRLNDYDRATASSYCAGCASICEAGLATAVPICKVMRYLMYAHGYGDIDRARRKFQDLPQEIRHVMAGLDYRSAEARCPRNMPIGRLMRRAVEELSCNA